MGMLILGLIVFLGLHSVRLVAERWRQAQFVRVGERRWKGLYSVASLVGLVLIIWGYGMARRSPLFVWAPPEGARHVTALFVAAAFILIAAAYVPGNHVKRAVGHPMYAGIALWAIGHLLANGTLHDIVLFGAFLIWAVAGWIVWRRRDHDAGVRYAAGTPAADVKVVVGGLVLWAVFAFALHGWLIGVRPFG
jgi:uncharacterized membrane protein